VRDALYYPNPTSPHLLNGFTSLSSRNGRSGPIPLGPRAVGSSAVLTRHRHSDAVLLIADKTPSLEFLMDVLVDLRRD
jgi:hypothetical protein